MILCAHCLQPSTPSHWLSCGATRPRVEQRRARQRGESNGRAVLTYEQVADIRESYGTGPSLADLARRHGCSKSTVHFVVTGQTW